MSPDTVIFNATIRTMDPARPFAEWIHMAGGRIKALGCGPSPQAETEIDAQGRLLLPGFQDAHIHLLSGGTDLATAAQLYDVTTLPQLLATLQTHAQAQPDLPLIIGTGWQAGLFGDANLNAATLDPATGNRPAILYDSSYHNACLNTAALILAGITADTPDPPNGHIVRDAQGHATGMLHEEAIPWAAARLPQLNDDHLMQGLLAAQTLAHRHGLTGVLDPRITDLEARIYARALRENRLTLRVAGAALVTQADTAESATNRLKNLRARHPGPDFHIHSAKVFMDGVFENRTAALLAPYADPPGGNAPCMFSADQTRALFTALDAARFAIHVHVIGDAATRRAVEGLEAALAANTPWPAAHQLAHLQLTDPADAARIAAVAMANIQPLWARLDPVIPDIALDMIGPARRGDTYAFRKLLNAGANWCLSSDWPVSTLNPFEIIETAITRQAMHRDAPGAPFLPDQALTVAQAVLGYTTGAATACWRAGFTGALKPGFSADMILLDRDIFTCAAQDISATEVLLTLVKGTAVHRAPNL